MILIFSKGLLYDVSVTGSGQYFGFCDFAKHAMCSEGAPGKLQGGEARETVTSSTESRKNCPRIALLRWLARACGCGLSFFPSFFFVRYFFPFFSVGT